MTDGPEKLAEPREAFALLSHDLRLDILLALLDHWEAVHTEPQRYSDLMRAVGMQDSGKFNYHLGKLRGAYLRQSDGGYAPTASATALYRAVLAHRPTETLARSAFDPGVDCPTCGESLTASYEREFITVRCSHCETIVDGFTYPLPKNAFRNRTDREVLRAAFDRARAHLGLARRGQCPDCAGTTTVAVDLDSLDTEGEQPVTISCDTCTWTVRVGFLLPLLTDARLEAVLTRIGISVEETYPWELPDPTVTVVATDPVRIELDIQGEEGAAEITLDDNLDVLSTARTAAGGSDQSNN